MAIENNSIHYWFKKIVENKLLKRITLIFMIVVFLFFSVWARAFIGSMKNFYLGEEYFFKDQYIRAITFFDRSMHWYTPVNPYIERAAEYLWKISNQADQINDVKLSLIALESIRNSFYSSRSFYSTGTEWIEKSERRIRNICKDQQEITIQSIDADGQDNIYESKMEYNDPNIFWTIILEIGFFGWIGSILCFVLSYIGAGNRSRGFFHSFLIWTLMAATSYGLWILGLVKA